MQWFNATGIEALTAATTASTVMQTSSVASENWNRMIDIVADRLGAGSIVWSVDTRCDGVAEMLWSFIRVVNDAKLPEESNSWRFI